MANLTVSALGFRLKLKNNFISVPYACFKLYIDSFCFQNLGRSFIPNAVSHSMLEGNKYLFRREMEGRCEMLSVRVKTGKGGYSGTFTMVR